MNATVKRIVDLMFEDLQTSDEVQTLHDEILANCQERCMDCLNRGMTEDEAIRVVIESLKGMEEVLAAYPKVTDAKQPYYTYQRNGADCQTNYSGSVIRNLRISLNGENVRLLPAHDDSFHAEYKADSGLAVREDGDTLVIERKRNAEQGGDHGAEFTMDAFGRNINMHASSFGELLKKMFTTIGSEIASTGSDITVYVPQSCRRLDVHTTSGDITADGVSASSLKTASTSGDIRLSLPVSCDHAEVSTASGDLELQMNAAYLQASTLSGDLTCRGHIVSGQLSTVSGDMTLEGSVNGSLKTVSGDIDLHTGSATLDVHTTSGDFTAYPAVQATVSLTSKTVSGSVRTGCHASAGQRADLVLNVVTVSGDIVIKD